jgi:hypothetical protein
MRILDPGWKIGSGMDKIRIRDKHPGSATLYEGYHIVRTNRKLTD